MIEHDNQFETGTDATVAGNASKKMPLASAAGLDGIAAPPAPINPDDLHDLFQGMPEAPDEEDPLAQLRNDPNYAALIRDLEYIAHAAKDLFATQEEVPSDKVWDNIVGELGKKTEE